MGDHQGSPESVHRYVLESVTNRLNSRYRTDADVKHIKPSQVATTVELFANRRGIATLTRRTDRS